MRGSFGAWKDGAVLLLMAAVVAACSPAPTPSVSAGASPSTAVAPSRPESPSPSPLPPGGIPEARAIELAREHTGTLRTFDSATVGELGDTTGLRTSLGPHDLVWDVRFTGELTVCPPPAPASGAPVPSITCLSPRPGATDVILDYRTGDWITTRTAG